MGRRLTYTFDNGPWPGATEKLLDFLARRSVKATFFVVGSQLARPEGRRLVEEAAAAGHWIGNHTLTHGTPLGRDGGIERVEREIGETEALLGPLAHPRRFFRPNGGGSLGPHLLSAEALDYLVRGRFTVVTWNSVPGDWVPPHRHWLERALADLDAAEGDAAEGDMDDWTVLVLHDRFIAEMMDTLERFHDALEGRGVEVVQDFPASCTVVDRGVVTGAAAEFSTPPAA